MVKGVRPCAGKGEATQCPDTSQFPPGYPPTGDLASEPGVGGWEGLGLEGLGGLGGLGEGGPGSHTLWRKSFQPCGDRPALPHNGRRGLVFFLSGRAG